MQPLTALILTVSVLSVSGCADEAPTTEEVVEQLTESTQGEPRNLEIEYTDPATVELPEGSDALGVVTAAILITSGNIDEAIASGRVTAVEVDYAVLAIEEQTLNLWKEMVLTEKE
jgi:hypothetical protein